MAKLKDKIQNSLDEGRMLLLGVQALLGFGYRAVLENGFDKLPVSSQYLKIGSLSLLLITLALMIWPGAYHRIVIRGEDTPDLHRFTTKVMDWALLPLGIGLSVDSYIVTAKVAGHTVGLVASGLVVLVAFGFWYGLAFIHRAQRKTARAEKRTMKNKKEPSPSGGTELTEKIKHALTEARMILPGAQALLGFQLISILTEGFDKLPAGLKHVHLASLALITLSTILLITPAAYHRMAEEGEETAHFHRLASLIISVALVPLALGICGDLFVVTRKITASFPLALTLSLLMLAIFYGLWFGFTLYRARHRPAGDRVVRAAAK